MIYLNYIRSYNNVIYRMDKINEDIPTVSGIKNINTSDNSFNNTAYEKRNDYVNNIKEYSKYNDESKELYPATKLKSDYINNTYSYNPSNNSILQANQMYSSGLFLNLLV